MLRMLVGYRHQQPPWTICFKLDSLHEDALLKFDLPVSPSEFNPQLHNAAWNSTCRSLSALFWMETLSITENNNQGLTSAADVSMDRRCSRLAIHGNSYSLIRPKNWHSAGPFNWEVALEDSELGAVPLYLISLFKRNISYIGSVPINNQNARSVN